jgi:hypothetical protein
MVIVLTAVINQTRATHVTKGLLNHDKIQRAIPVAEIRAADSTRIAMTVLYVL